jgi:hypothetical protein
MVFPFLDTDRISFHVPTDRGIVIAEVVIIEPRLSIIVLPRESEVVGDRGDGDSRFTEGFIVSRPYNSASRVCHLLRGGEMIVVVVVCIRTFYLRQRLAIQIDIFCCNGT